MTDTPITTLPGLGAKSAAMLATIGVRTCADLKARGAVGTWLALKAAGQPASLNLLWALEGALTGRDWRVVSRTDRLRLLLEVEAHGERR